MKKRLLSILLACMLVVSLASMSFASSDTRMEVKRGSATEVFELVNKEREKQGYAPLEWVEDLYQPAVTRAKELYESFSHTRPDGSSWNTVSELAHGENISWNRLTPVSVRVPEEGETVKTNTDTSKKKATVVGSDEKKNATVGGSPIVEAENSPAVTTTADKNTSQAIIKKANELAGKTTGVVNPIYSSADVTLTPAVLKELNNWEKTNNRTLAISYDTYVPKTAGVQGRMTVLPSRLVDQKEEITVEVFNKSDNVTRVKKLFESWFSNDLEVLELKTTNTLDGYVDIAARIRLVDLDKDSLVFYTYDAKENTYSLQENLKYSIDKNGYVHFTTKGDFVIVTDKNLA